MGAEESGVRAGLNNSQVLTSRQSQNFPCFADKLKTRHESRIYDFLININILQGSMGVRGLFQRFGPGIYPKTVPHSPGHIPGLCRVKRKYPRHSPPPWGDVIANDWCINCDALCSV